MITKEWILYRHTSPSGKIYIGITSDVPQHRWENGKGYKHCTLFYKAIVKYGWDNIKHEVLFTELSEQKAKSLEIDLIRHYKKLGISYNITDGGDGALGRITSEETKAKQRAKKIGRPLSEEHKAKIKKYAEKLKGVPRTEEVKRKLHKANKGKKPSPQTIKALKEYNTKHPISKERIVLMHESSRNKGYKNQKEALNRKRKQIGEKHRRPVVQFNLNGEYVATYEGAKFAEIDTNTDRSMIATCCKGRQIRANNCFWMYESDYLEYKQKGILSSVLQTLIDKVNRKIVRSTAYRGARSKVLKGKDFRSNATKELMRQKAIEANSKPIIQLTMDDKPVRIFKNGSDIHKQLGYSQGYISSCCNGKKDSAYGYKWKFIDPD